VHTTRAVGFGIRGQQFVDRFVLEQGLGQPMAQDRVKQHSLGSPEVSAIDADEPDG